VANTLGLEAVAFVVGGFMLLIHAPGIAREPLVVLI